MADFKINGKNVVTQSGVAEPVVASNVTGGSGLNAVNAANIAAGVLPVGVTGGSGLNAVSPANLASGVLPVGVTGGSGLNAVPSPFTLSAAQSQTGGNAKAFTGTGPGGGAVWTVKERYDILLHGLDWPAVSSGRSGL